MLYFTKESRYNRHLVKIDACILKGLTMTKAEQILDKLKPLIDPEMHISIVDLGLVRDVDVSEDGKVASVTLTVTNPACPIMDELMEAVAYQTGQVDGIEVCDVEIEIDPPWDPRVDATEEGKAELGIWD